MRTRGYARGDVSDADEVVGDFQPASGQDTPSSEGVADQPRSQFAQNQRNVMSAAVIFVSSFTDPGASQCWHLAGMVSVRGFVDLGMAVTPLVSPDDVLADRGSHVAAQACARGVTALHEQHRSS